MFHVCLSLYMAVLFFILTPGILLRLPKGGSKMAVAATHAVVFALVFYFTHNMVVSLYHGREGFTASPMAQMPVPRGIQPPMGKNQFVVPSTVPAMKMNMQPMGMNRKM